MATEQNIVSRLMTRFYKDCRIDPLDAAFCVHAQPGMKVLDAGCGGARGCLRKSPWQQMHITGADADPAVMNNPFCDEKVICDLSSLPFESNSFDLIHCRWVLEHLADPQKVFSEFARVLKPGGRLLALTPNVLHYATVISRITPSWFHDWWLKGQGDHYRVYYRANSSDKLRRLCAGAGFAISRIEFIEGPPQYFPRFAPGFLCGMVYERIVNSSQLFQNFRQKILLDVVLTAQEKRSDDICIAIKQGN